ncbi:MAG: TRZ/ATZ family protein [Lachnospiraceae bacterium]|nr:TRZ/ATZ family protein [Lachnospiraceae bacterium]
MDKHIATPITAEVTKELHAGDYVYISGTIYVARDAAHKRFMEVLDKAEEQFVPEQQNEAGRNKLTDVLPFPLENAAVYYMGPSPAREGRPIGSAGPTTASRMDKYAPRLLDLGQKAMIGKGKRTQAVIDAIVRNQAVYFAAVGGAGALLSKCIKKSDLVCYGDLGAEAVLKLEVEDFPVVVVIDCEGNNLYETAVKKYAQET